MSYWLIAIPAEVSKEASWSRLQDRTVKQADLSANVKFKIPELRVGTLDSLLELSDDLNKIDLYVESVVHKIERTLKDVSPTTTLLVNNIKQVGVSPDDYLQSFTWDEAKFSLKNSLKELTTIISEEVSKSDDESKLKINEFQQVKGSLAAVRRKAQGNLMVRSLAEVVGRKDFIESENLTTLLVVVPRFSSKDFLTCYENLTNYVVPRSALKLSEDNEYELYRVVLFRRVAEDYKHACREKRFNVREFVWDDKAVQEAKTEKSRLENESDQLQADLVRWLKTAFSEMFIDWIHLKAIRVFVESILRYGLPANFLAVLLKPVPKKVKSLREALYALYSHLGGAQYSTSAAETDAGPGAQEFYPYVYFAITPLTALEG